MGAVQKLPAKQHSQSSPIWVKIGWIGCAVQHATSKWLTGFFCFNISFLFFLLSMKSLRPKPAHFCHLIFQLQVVCIQKNSLFICHQMISITYALKCRLLSSLIHQIFCVVFIPYSVYLHTIGMRYQHIRLAQLFD